MLKAGIVGTKNSSKYIKALNGVEFYNYTGIYDPSFQIDLSLFNSIEQGFLNYSELIESSDVLIFSSDNKVSFPLMKEALFNSKSLLLDGVQKLTYDQLYELAEIAYEANSQVHVYHPNMFHEIVLDLTKNELKPLLIQENLEIQELDKILKTVREEITVLLTLVKNKVRKTRAVVMSSQEAIPNIYHISLEFNNGCLYNLLASSIGLPYRKEQRFIGQNFNIESSFNNHTIDKTKGSENEIVHYKPNENTEEHLITRQLDEFYRKTLDNNCFEFSLQYEMEAAKVIEKITEKLKVCMNIL